MALGSVAMLNLESLRVCATIRLADVRYREDRLTFRHS